MNSLTLAAQLIQNTDPTCTLNGQEVPCDELLDAAQPYMWMGGVAMMAMLALGIASFVFWLMMLMHACTHENKDKTLWILIIVFTGFIGAVIYYFVVKRELQTK